MVFGFGGAQTPIEGIITSVNTKHILANTTNNFLVLMKSSYHVKLINKLKLSASPTHINFESITSFPKASFFIFWP